MYIYSKTENVQYIPERNTHSTDKFVFKTETKIGTKYEKSAFYQGTKPWNNLSREIQDSEDKWIFKSQICKLYKVFTNEL